jgi:hypothetical protein
MRSSKVVGYHSRADAVLERAGSRTAEAGRMSDSQFTAIGRLSERLVTLKERL